MGNATSVYVSYKDMQTAVRNEDMYVLINTMPLNEQECVILRTVDAHNEDVFVNNLLATARGTRIVVYGKNTTDATVDSKFHQLKKLGFRNLYIYRGGMFEWLLLQEVYGAEHFPTRGSGEILNFKSPSILSHQEQTIVAY